MADSNAGRPNQRRRTRKDLLLAAGRLMQQGRKPTLDEIAEHALVSRATAYRYFPNVDALLAEAALDLGLPGPGEFFGDDRTTDPVARVERVDRLLHEHCLVNEPQLRVMLAHSVQRPLLGDGDDTVPARQNRRSPLIDAALAPAEGTLRARDRKLLRQALALIVGTEAMIVCKDVLQLDDAEARNTKRWAIRALVEAARKPPGRN